MRSVVRLLVAQDEWNIALISVQRQRSREAATGRTPTTFSRDHKSHRDTAGEPCGNDGIDAHVEKRWRTSIVVHRASEAPIDSIDTPVHHRFATIALKTPSRELLTIPLESLREGVFNNPLENPALCMQTQTDQSALWENLTLLPFTMGFPHYHKACDCCFFWGGGERSLMRKKAKKPTR